MNDEQLNQILNYLDKIGEKIGKTSEQIWPWLVKQQYVQALYPFFIMIISGLLFYIFTNKEKNINFNNFNLKTICYVIFICIFGITFLGSFIVSITEFIDAFNPQYAALKDLLNMVK